MSFNFLFKWRQCFFLFLFFCLFKSFLKRLANFTVTMVSDEAPVDKLLDPVKLIEFGFLKAEERGPQKVSYSRPLT